MAAKRVKVVVTDEDIRCGRRGNGTRCAVARAARRALPKQVEFVDNEGISTHDGFYTFAKRVAKFIFDFDSKKAVKPITFTATRAA